MQFHWWDYSEPRWLEAFGGSMSQADGKVRQIGGTNFDALHLRQILEAGVPLVSMQVQYSLLDHRPERGIAALCAARRVGLLCYGSVAGGFLSDRWLGAAEPAGPLANRSLTKYKLIIDEFGGWPLFQELLAALAGSPTGTASTWRPSPAPRFSADPASPPSSSARVARASRPQTPRSLDPADAADQEEIGAITARRLGPGGDVYALERDRAGRHGAIMKYNLARSA